MKNLEIVAIVNAYMALKGQERKDFRLPAAVAWKRRVNMDKLIRAKQLIDEAMRELQERYADDDHSEEKDGVRTVKPEFRKEFFEAQGEILAQETDVDIRKVSIDAIGDVEITDEEMDTLAFMIEEGE